jgi:MFS family permease
VIFFDVSRAFQGIGPALLLPNVIAIAGRTYAPGTKKNIVFSLIASSAPFGCAIGCLIGAAFAEHAWWPWAFWLSGILCFVLAGLAYVVIPQDKAIDTTVEGLGFDWAGSITGVSGLVAIKLLMEPSADRRLVHALRIRPAHHRSNPTVSVRLRRETS